MTGLYAFCLSAVYGITMYTLSDYSDLAFLEAIVETKTASATVYPWQIRMLSQSPEVCRYDLSCLKVLITGGGLLSATIRMEVTNTASIVQCCCLFVFVCFSSGGMAAHTP